MPKNYVKVLIHYRKISNWHLGVVKVWYKYQKSGGNDQKEFLHHGY
jgi:hypothetical protein